MWHFGPKITNVNLLIKTCVIIGNLKKKWAKKEWKKSALFIKEWRSGAHSIFENRSERVSALNFLLMSEIWAKLKKKVSVELVAVITGLWVLSQSGNRFIFVITYIFHKVAYINFIMPTVKNHNVAEVNCWQGLSFRHNNLATRIGLKMY